MIVVSGGILMKKTLLAGMMAAAASVMVPGLAGAEAVTADVPTGSVYYDYVDKLSGMGYIDALPDGARPYSRMQMAKWVLQAEKNAKDKPMPAYLADELASMRQAFASEIEVLKGHREQEDVALREASLRLASYNSDQSSYRQRRNGSSAQPHAHWQPFGQGTNGYDYADSFNAVAKAEVAGNIGHKTAVSLTPRLSWNDDDDAELKLEEGYVKTKTGIVEYLAGRQALSYGQGKTGTLVLDDTMKPMTMVQAHLEDDMPVRGFFRFLGKQNYHVFYGQLEGDRRDRAVDHKDFDHAGLLGVRADFTPSDAFTFGLMRVSMLGGERNGLSKSDWRHWVTGRNDEAGQDRWNDIAGGDFRVRLPGVQFYGEVYGEDAGGLQPTERGYRFGTYLPQLTRDGSWDMTLEYASTNPAWYVHQKYQNGWTYSDDIIGDSMGNNAKKYYLGVNHYLPGENQIGAYFMRTQMDRGAMNPPNVYEAALTGRLKLQDHFFLDGSLGLAKIDHADYTDRTDRNVFATATARWQY